MNEPTRRLFDFAAFCLAAVSGVTVISALNMVAVIMSILAAAVSISWGLCRWRDRLKYGPPKGG